MSIDQGSSSLTNSSADGRRLVVSTAEPGPLGSVEVSMTPQERFEEYLQSRGLRHSEQRRLLVDLVFSRHEHFDADMLIDNLPRKGKPGYVSPATVYRTLKEFVDAGLLNSFQLDGRTVFEHDYGYPKHDHLYCTRCRRLVEFRSEQLIELRNQVCADNGFRVLDHRFIINGICGDCTKARRRKKRKQDLV